MSVCFIPPYTPLLYRKTGVYRGIHYFLIFALKHRLWVLVRTASFTIYVLRKNVKIVKKSTENCHFYSCEKSLYGARACFRNGFLLTLAVLPRELSYSCGLFVITKTRQCNIQQYFTAVKMFIFR